VLGVLRDAIIVGQLADGERLIEERIARELKTSRGPVREALRQLEHEGLVVSYPYRGAVVMGVSDEEVHEVLIPVRLTLERYSFLKAIERLAEDDMAELAKEVWVMGEAAREGDLLRTVEADIRFHEFVLEHADQPHTAQVWGAIAPRIRAYFFRYGAVSDLSRIAAEHATLLSALQTRDPETVVAAVEQHIAVPTPQVS
jgi:DNA-binding GntR family transcriptional regulator